MRFTPLQGKTEHTYETRPPFAEKITRIHPQSIWQGTAERPEYYFLLYLGDLLALVLSFLLAATVRIYLSHCFPSLYPYTWDLAFVTIRKFWWFLVPVSMALIYQRVYDRRLPFWEEARELCKALILAFIIIYAILAMGKVVDEVSRLTIGLMLIFSLFLFPSLRYILKYFLFKFSLFRRKALILGAHSGAVELIKSLQAEPFLGYEVIGILDDDRQKHGKYIEGKKVYGAIRQISKFVSFLAVESVFIAVPSFTSKQLSDLFAYVQSFVKEVCIVPEFKNFGMLNADTYTLFQEKIFLITVRNNLKSPLNQLIKRLFDILISLLLLPILTPLMFILTILIIIDSPGFPIFVHERIGKNGKKIRVYKFRSMYKNSQELLEKYLKNNKQAQEEWNEYFKLKYDPRITRIGKFLRKTSLDELPQIINVLKGDMSLVGPRPVTSLELNKYYQKYASFYCMVRPGITGLWQVSGRNKINYQDRVKMDIWYTLNWSLWLDIVLLLRTLVVVLKREGSY